VEPLTNHYEPREVPRPVADVAAAQFGVVTRAQLLEAGVDSCAISRQVRAGRLHRLHRGVYAVGHRVLVPNGQRLAAVLACGPGAALSHASAAALHGLWQSSARMHISVPRNGPHTRDGPVVHRVRRLAEEDVTTVAGIRVTTVARTALDVAETSPPRIVAILLERADQHNVLDLAELRATVDRNPGRHGAKVLVEALDVEPPSKRELQRRFLRLCRAHGLPEPEQEVQIGPYHVDFLWRDARLVVEADGRAYHEVRAAFERDRRRDLDLAARGLQTLRVTWQMVTRQAESLALTLRRRVRFDSI
jgi:very-short-patch-repair endonuclease